MVQKNCSSALSFNEVETAVASEVMREGSTTAGGT